MTTTGRGAQRDRVARRCAGVLAGLVLGGVTVGIGVAHADDVVWGCPSGYSLTGALCRAADGSTVSPLGLLPGDADPTTGRILRPVTTSPVPTTTPAPTTTSPVPTTTSPVPTSPVPTTSSPAPTTTCPRPGTPSAADGDVARTAAAVEQAKARLAADTRRGVSAAVIRADVQALATAFREHAAAVAAQGRTACPTR